VDSKYRSERNSCKEIEEIERNSERQKEIGEIDRQRQTEKVAGDKYRDRIDVQKDLKSLNSNEWMNE
jgi:hypothetical protein